MSQNNLELKDAADGNIYLNYWDSMHGEDAIFVLGLDGKARQQTWNGDEEVLTEVDLVKALRDLARSICA